MRALFNEQNAVGAIDPAELARLALCRRLVARMAPLERYDELTKTRSLVTESREWSNAPIDFVVAGRFGKHRP